MTDTNALRAEIEHHFFKNEVIADSGLIDDLLAFVELQRKAAADAMEKAEYELAMGKSIIDQFLTDEGRKSLGYCGTGKCGLCPMCRMNNALNILKFSRPLP